MPVLRAKPGQWCDYCKTRFPKEHVNHSKPASWTVVSESADKLSRERHYCQSCSEIVSEWNGEIWELQDQINYAVIRNGERLNV